MKSSSRTPKRTMTFFNVFTSRTQYPNRATSSSGSGSTVTATPPIAIFRGTYVFIVGVTMRSGQRRLMIRRASFRSALMLMMLCGCSPTSFGIRRTLGPRSTRC